MGKGGSYYLYFTKNQNELPRQLILRQALSRAIALASILIKYGFIY